MASCYILNTFCMVILCFCLFFNFHQLWFCIYLSYCSPFYLFWHLYLNAPLGLSQKSFNEWWFDDRCNEKQDIRLAFMESISLLPPELRDCETVYIFIWMIFISLSILSVSSLHHSPHRLHSQCFWTSPGGSGQASGLQPGSGSVYFHVLQQAGHHHWQGQAS